MAYTYLKARNMYKKAMVSLQDLHSERLEIKPALLRNGQGIDEMRSLQ
jgi:hypothetical protein